MRTAQSPDLYDSALIDVVEAARSGSLHGAIAKKTKAPRFSLHSPASNTTERLLWTVAFALGALDTCAQLRRPEADVKAVGNVLQGSLTALAALEDVQLSGHAAEAFGLPSQLTPDDPVSRGLVWAAAYEMSERSNRDSGAKLAFVRDMGERMAVGKADFTWAELKEVLSSAEESTDRAVELAHSFQPPTRLTQLTAEQGSIGR